MISEDCKFAIKLDGCGFLIEACPFNQFSNGPVRRGVLWRCSIMYGHDGVDVKAVRKHIQDTLSLIRAEEYADLTPQEMTIKLLGCEIIDDPYASVTWSKEDVQKAVEKMNMYDKMQFYSVVDGYVFRLYRGPQWKFEFRGSGSCPDELRIRVNNALQLMEKKEGYADMSLKEFFDKVVVSEA